MSNFDVPDLEEAWRIAGEDGLVCNQVLYHLQERAIEHTVIPWCEKHGVAVVADTKGLLLTFDAKEGNEQKMEQFLRDARPMVEKEPDTTAWFAIRLDDGKYGIFDVFPDNRRRFKRPIMQVPREMAQQALTLLGGVPDMEMLNLVAEKLGSKVAVAQA